MHLVCYTTGYNLYTLAPILINEAYYRSFTDHHIQSVSIFFIFKIYAALIPSILVLSLLLSRIDSFLLFFSSCCRLRIIMKTDTNTDDMQFAKTCVSYSKIQKFAVIWNILTRLHVRYSCLLTSNFITRIISVLFFNFTLPIIRINEHSE